MYEQREALGAGRRTAPGECRRDVAAVAAETVEYRRFGDLAAGRNIAAGERELAVGTRIGRGGNARGRQNRCEPHSCKPGPPHQGTPLVLDSRAECAAAGAGSANVTVVACTGRPFTGDRCTRSTKDQVSRAPSGP